MKSRRRDNGRGEEGEVKEQTSGLYRRINQGNEVRNTRSDRQELYTGLTKFYIYIFGLYYILGVEYRVVIEGIVSLLVEFGKRYRG